MVRADAACAAPSADEAHRPRGEDHRADSARKALGPDFRALLGEEAWAALPAPVRRRFTGHAEPIAYPGRMRVEASCWGALIAGACRLIGTPLAPFTGEDVAVSVLVAPDGRGGLVWARTYLFQGRAPLTVSSTKTTDRQGKLLEVVRGGLGMALDLSVEDGALHFRSRGYFLRLLGLRLAIPPLLTPGAAHVVHTEVGGGWFEFAMAFDHPLLGRTFHQRGLFRDPEDA